MLERAGAVDLRSELDRWSAPENFWTVRQDRDVEHPRQVLTVAERLRTIARIVRRYGPRGVVTALANERAFYRAVLSGKLGYGLYWGRVGAAAGS